MYIIQLQLDAVDITQRPSGPPHPQPPGSPIPEKALWWETLRRRQRRLRLPGQKQQPVTDERCL